MDTDAAIAEADAQLAADRAALLAELEATARELDETTARLRHRRYRLYERGRELGITFKVLGDAAGRSEVSVVQELQKDAPSPDPKPRRKAS